MDPVSSKKKGPLKEIKPKLISDNYFCVYWLVIGLYLQKVIVYVPADKSWTFSHVYLKKSFCFAMISSSNLYFLLDYSDSCGYFECKVTYGKVLKYITLLI